MFAGLLSPAVRGVSSAGEAPAGNEVTVEGVVATVTYENQDSGFRVVKVDVDNRRDRLTLVGVFPRVGVGSRVRARGTIEVNPQHGEQLRAIHVTELAPTTLAGIEKYLGSGLIKGVGGVTAAVTGDPAVFVSVSAAHQGPEGGGPVAAIVDLGEEPTGYRAPAT